MNSYERVLTAMRRREPDRVPILEFVIHHRKAIVFLQRAAFMHSVSLRGFENLLADFVADPTFAHELMDKVLEVNLRLARNAIRAGADIVVLADDYAGNKTTFFSPAHFEEFVRPRLKRMVDAIHEAGALVIKHSDGNLWRILDRIVDTGVDAINPLEPVDRRRAIALCRAEGSQRS
jgi:uroporphyrinogen decarboxylase